LVRCLILLNFKLPLPVVVVAAAILVAVVGAILAAPARTLAEDILVAAGTLAQDILVAFVDLAVLAWEPREWVVLTSAVPLISVVRMRTD
jgi:hypothetical protein